MTVELILNRLAGRLSFADLLEAYPFLIEEDLRAALNFAANFIRRAYIENADDSCELS